MPEEKNQNQSLALRPPASAIYPFVCVFFLIFKLSFVNHNDVIVEKVINVDQKSKFT